MTNNRIIHTSMYSSVAKQILANFFKYMRENTEHRMYRNTNRVEVEIAPDGEILLDACRVGCKDKHGNWHYGRSIWDRNLDNDAKPKEWLALAIKHHVVETFRSDGAWRRGNDCALVQDFATKDTESTSTFTPSVAQLYCVYDHLLGRKNLERKYDAELVKTVIGTRKDPIMTEMEINRRNEVKRINSEFESAKAIANEDRRRRLAEYDEQLTEAANIKIEEARAARDKALAELEEAMNKILAMKNS